MRSDAQELRTERQDETGSSTSRFYQTHYLQDNLPVTQGCNLEEVRKGLDSGAKFKWALKKSVIKIMFIKIKINAKIHNEQNLIFKK